MPRQRAWLHPPRSGWHPVEWGCELLGTALLVFGGLSAVVLDFGAHSPVAGVVRSHSLRLLLTGTLFAGTGALVTISPLGRRSGAHLNPAVSFAFWCHRHLHLSDLGGYAAAQCLGGLLGAGAIRLAWGARGAPVRWGLTQPGRGLTAADAVGVEALMTAIMVLVIFAFVSSPRTAHWTPWAVLVVVAVLVWQGAPYTGTSLNPARSLGPAVVVGDFHAYWAYAIGPLAGGGLAALVWVLVPRSTLTAKLYHDARYRSVLGSLLPVRTAHVAASGRPAAPEASGSGAPSAAPGQR